MKRIASFAAATTLVAGCTIITALAQQATASAPGAADEVRAWNAITMSTMLAAATPVPAQPLFLTYVHRAVYNAVRSALSHDGDSVEAAVVAAAHDVLVSDFPPQQAVLDADYTQAVDGIPASAARAKGLRTGARAARRLLADRAEDGRDGPEIPAPIPGVGIWTPTPPNVVGVTSWLGQVRPFVIRSSTQFRAAPPPALTSSTWARDYNETRLYGSGTSTLRTAEQTEVARFWGDPPYVQNQAALRDYTAAHGLDVLHTAQLFALADTAAADALITCFETKYHYEFWRPIAAIPAGDSDGNPVTPSDPAWQPLLTTPNHPEYASAHGCATGAMATVIAGLTSRSGTGLDLYLSSTATGTTHHFTSLSQLLDEVANARIWAGLHWRFSTTAGVRIGQAVARVVLKHVDRGNCR